MTNNQTNWRALCAELLSALENEGYAHWRVPPDEDKLCLRARTALIQPEPEGPTDNQLLECMLKAAASVPGGQCTGILDWDKEAIAAARAILARWGK